MIALLSCETMRVLFDASLFFFKLTIATVGIALLPAVKNRRIRPEIVTSYSLNSVIQM